MARRESDKSIETRGKNGESDQGQLERQQLVVTKAIEALEKEIGTVGWPKQKIEEFLNYTYSIGFNHGRKQSRHGKRVAQIKDGIIIKVYESASDAGRAVNRTKHIISKAALGKIPGAANYDWKYL